MNMKELHILMLALVATNFCEANYVRKQDGVTPSTSKLIPSFEQDTKGVGAAYDFVGYVRKHDGVTPSASKPPPSFEQDMTGVGVSYEFAGSVPSVVRKTHEAQGMQVDAHGNIEKSTDDMDKALSISMARVHELESELRNHKNRILELEATLENTKTACAEKETLHYDVVAAKVDATGTNASSLRGTHDMAPESVRWTATYNHVNLYYGGDFDLLEADINRNRNTHGRMSLMEQVHEHEPKEVGAEDADRAKLPKGLLETSVEDHQATSGWVKGDNGQSCDNVCEGLGLACDSTEQSSLTTNELVRDAFAAAGYTCKGFHGARDYAGTPFSTGRLDDCAPISAGSTSACSANKIGYHAALCYCKAPSSIDATRGLVTAPFVQADGYAEITEGAGATGAILAFDVECEGNATVTFKAEIIADGKSDSFFLQLDDGAKQVWHTGRRSSWSWSTTSPSISMSAGSHKVKLRGREDGIKIRALRFESGMVEAGCVWQEVDYFITSVNVGDCPSGTYRIESSYGCETAADILGFHYMGASEFYRHPRGCTIDLDNKVTHNFVSSQFGQPSKTENLLCARTNTCATHLCPDGQQHKLDAETLTNPTDSKCCEVKAQGAECMERALCEAEIGELKNDKSFMCDCVFNHKGIRDPDKCHEWLKCLHEQRSVVQVWFKRVLEFSTNTPLSSSGTSLVQLSGSSNDTQDACFDPSKQDVFSLGCDCAADLQQKCGSKMDDQDCLNNYACGSPSVCASWKEGRCPSDSAQSLSEIRHGLESRAGSLSVVQSKDTAEETLRSKC